MQTLADRLAQVGERSRLSIREAAIRARMSFGYLSRLHSGVKESPTLDTLVQLADVYQTTPEFLRDGNPTVDMWAELTRDAQFRVAGTKDPSARVELVVSFAARKYPGHLRRDDFPVWIGRPLTPVDDDLLVRLAELTGVPVTWLRIGHFSFIPQDAIGDWPELMEFLDAYAREKRVGAR